MDTPESRLKAATTCGLIRDGHAMALVRVDDVRGIVAACSIFEREGKAAREQLAQVTATKDDALKEVQRLKRGIAESITTLQNAACDTY